MMIKTALRVVYLTCSLVFTTSAGFTNAADIDPDAHPDMNDHQKTDSVDPGYFLGPRALRFANRGK